MVIAKVELDLAVTEHRMVGRQAKLPGALRLKVLVAGIDPVAGQFGDA